jgi:hypothetical protein
MAKKRSKKDFIAFILAAEQDPRLTRDFISKTNATDLCSFFEKEGFTEISKDNCTDILRSKTKRFATGQQIAGNPPPPCPPNARY